MEMTVTYCMRSLGNMYCAATAAGGQAGHTDMVLDMFMWENELNYLACRQTSIP